MTAHNSAILPNPGVVQYASQQAYGELQTVRA